MCDDDVVTQSPPLPPFTLVGLDHVVLRTAQVEALVRFYRALGCEVVRAVPEIGLTQLRAGRSMIDLVDVDGVLGSRGGAAPGDEGRNLDHLALRVEPFDRDAIARLAARLGTDAVDPGGPLLGAEGFGPAVYLTDPDGNTVELKGPAEP